MKAFLHIDDDLIGKIDFKIIDESMGVIGGDLIPYQGYAKYKEQIQILYDKKGIANMDDLNFTISFKDGSTLSPEGGIGVTHSSEFDEIYVESAGINSDILQKFA